MSSSIGRCSKVVPVYASPTRLSRSSFGAVVNRCCGAAARPAHRRIFGKAAEASLLDLPRREVGAQGCRQHGQDDRAEGQPGQCGEAALRKKGKRSAADQRHCGGGADRPGVPRLVRGETLERGLVETGLLGDGAELRSTTICVAPPVALREIAAFNPLRAKRVGGASAGLAQGLMARKSGERPGDSLCCVSSEAGDAGRSFAFGHVYFLCHGRRRRGYAVLAASQADVGPLGERAKPKWAHAQQCG